MLGGKDYREPKEGLEEFWALGLRTQGFGGLWIKSLGVQGFKVSSVGFRIYSS